MIKGKIYTRRKIKDKNGNEWTNYKIYYKGVGFWVSSLDFKNHLLEQEDFLIIDMPVAATKMKSNNGEFLKIIPKLEDQKPANFVKEQAATYRIKEIAVNKLKFFDLNEVIEEAKNNKRKNENQKAEKGKGTKSPKPSAKASQQKVNKKTDFIATLLDYTSHKNTDNKNRKKLHELISQEIEKSRLSKEEVEKIVEEKMNEVKSNKLKEIKLSKHKPKDVSTFLSLFRGTDHPLKYLIHDYTKPNSEFDIDTFNKDVEASYHNESKNYYIPYSLKGRLTTFIGINKKYIAWFFKNKSNTFSFRNKEVISWCKNNPGKHPIKKFHEDINRFRDSIVIDKNLPEIIKFAVSDTIYFQNIQLQFDEEAESARILTDVDALISGLKCIFNSIGQHNTKQSISQVKISFKAKSTSENRLRILTITHLDSVCDKNLDEEIFGGDLKDAKNYFYQLCDWTIIAKNINSEYNKMNILYNQEIDIQKKEKVDNEIAGFSHILTFYS